MTSYTRLEVNDFLCCLDNCYGNRFFLSHFFEENEYCLYGTFLVNALVGDCGFQLHLISQFMHYSDVDSATPLFAIRAIFLLYETNSFELFHNSPILTYNHSQVQENAVDSF